MKKSDLKLMVQLHPKDIILLIAVLSKIKPIASLVVSLEVEEWLQKFCSKNHIFIQEDGPRDSFQTRVSISLYPEKLHLKRELGSFRSFLTKKAQRTPEWNNLMKGLTWVEGTMYNYPECCIKLHAEKGPSSRARAYEQLLNSGRDQSVPIEFWAVAHAPCSSTCVKTLELGRKYLDSLNEFSDVLKQHVESRLLLPRFYQTGGGRFIELEQLNYQEHQQKLTVSKEKFEKEARTHLPEPVQTLLCKVPRPYVLFSATEKPPYRMVFPNPEMVGTMWLAYAPGHGAYIVNAENSRLTLYVTSDKWLPSVGEEWRSKSNFRIYKSKKTM